MCLNQYGLRIVFEDIVVGVYELTTKINLYYVNVPKDNC